ncbi:hypothetical protein HanOQP8_Chr02g0050521 [Helianthus annuus]|nr:hypothetical protein HanOQP8_Chr02g0050521 [Helianthus annuus]
MMFSPFLLYTRMESWKKRRIWIADSDDEEVEFEATTITDEDFYVMLNFDDEDLE